MRYIYSIFFILLANISLATQVLVLVDGKAITTVDVEKRIEALQLATPTLINDINLKRKTLNMLISEELFHNEAKRLKMSVSEEEIKSHFKSLQRDFNFTEAQTESLMKNKSLWKQVESQMLWNKLVSAVFYSKVKVSDAEVQEEQKIRQAEIKEVTFKQVLFRALDENKIDKIRAEATDCNHLDASTKAQNLQKPYQVTLPFADLNPELQTIVKNLPLNKLSDILNLNGQKQAIMICNKVLIDKPQDTHQIRQELGSRKINAEAQKYLAELKKRIYVEYVTPIE